MAEFLTCEEIDALLDVAEDYEDDSELSQDNKIIEILNFSADLVDNIQKKNRVQTISDCSKIINYIDSILKEYNLNISDLISYNYKLKENEFRIEMPRRSKESNDSLSNSSIRDKVDEFSEKHFTEKLKYEEVFKYEDITGEFKLKETK